MPLEWVGQGSSSHGKNEQPALNEVSSVAVKCFELLLLFLSLRCKSFPCPHPFSCQSRQLVFVCARRLHERCFVWWVSLFVFCQIALWQKAKIVFCNQRWQMSQSVVASCLLIFACYFACLLHAGWTVMLL